MINFIFKKKYLISAIFLILALVLLLIGLFKLENNSIKPGIVEKSTEQNDWTKYTSEKFNFSISFPSGWKIYEDFSNKDVPKINIYKEKYKITLPLDNLSPDTNISIFPLGIPTDAVIGNVSYGKIDLADQSVKSTDYILIDKNVWASYSKFENRPESWKPWGFIWVNNEIQNLVYKCFQGQTEVNLDNCNTFEGDTLERSGKIDLKIRDEQNRILKTFKFID